MARNVAVVAHTHWDREWYEGFPAFRARLVGAVGGLLDRLEAEPALRTFLLDGQMALVDDYLSLRPGDASRLGALVRAGRVSLGPWYALMDEFLVSGETIVRNLQLGMARAASFGGHLPVGYLPDMFGHIGQMPQLLRQAGLADAVVWRGVPAAIGASAFWWRSPDGSTVRAEYLPAGYGNGAALPEDPEALVRRLRAHHHHLASFLAPHAPLLFLHGTDHQLPDPWLIEVVDKANALQEEFSLSITGLAEYLAEAPTEGLPEWQGELRSGARANLLMGVLSNRVDVKIAATLAERAVEARAEPLVGLWGRGEAWHDELLERAWLALIRNSAHDSVCACSADEVALAVTQRYAEATGSAEAVSSAVLDGLLGRFALPGPVALNLRPSARSGLVELVVPGSTVPSGTQVLEEVPAGTVERVATGRELPRLLGELSAARWLVDGQGAEADVTWTPDGVDVAIVLDPVVDPRRSLRSVAPAMAEAAAQAAANPDRTLRVRVERRASLRVLADSGPVPGYGWKSLALGAELSPHPPVRGGDNWLDNGLVHLAVNPADGTFALNGLSGLDRLVDQGDAGDTYNYAPPEVDLVVGRPDRVAVALVEDGPLRGTLVVERHFTWPERIRSGRRVGAAAATVTTSLQVHAGEPLVRVTTSFDNPCRDRRLRTWFPLPARATGSEAECAFGVARRGLHAEGGPGEAPLPTFPSRRWVRAGGLTVTHEGLHEYELIDDGWSLALTLLRSTGVISAPVLPTRSNAAGPATPTPGAQLVGPVRFRYAVALGDIDPWELVDTVWHPLEVIHVQGGGELAAVGSHLQVDGAVVSSLRRVGGHLELRVFNPGDEATTVSVEGRSGWLVDLTGRPLEAWSGRFRLRAWGIATVRLDPPA
jgi:mannosylglycerate hydrolase